MNKEDREKEIVESLSYITKDNRPIVLLIKILVVLEMLLDKGA